MMTPKYLQIKNWYLIFEGRYSMHEIWSLPLNICLKIIYYTIQLFRQEGGHFWIFFGQFEQQPVKEVSDDLVYIMAEEGGGMY